MSVSRKIATGPALKSFLRRLGSVVLIGLLPAWVWWAGSYSPARDLIVIALWAMLVLYIRGRGRKVLAGRSLASTIDAVLHMRVILVWLLGGWISLSTIDRVFQEPPVIRTGNVLAAPPGMRTDLAGKRISLALSGGGYRAALLHAGVMMQLSELGVPITNISSVSGGSIIGSFVATGGSPADFVEAVRAGRFRLKRELTSALVLPRWLFPLGNYSRRDAQAEILRRVLLPPDAAHGDGPELVVAMTDLGHVASVGVLRDGYMVSGPTASRFFRKGSAISMDDLGDLADIVAISGAFPGAFPPKRVTARFTRDPVDIATSSNVAELNLILTDGGVRDNLGLKLLEALHDDAQGEGRASSSWQGFQPGGSWAQDLILVSDGGATMQIANSVAGPLEELMRAIDVASLETGIVRLIDTSRMPPKRFLALPALVTRYPDSAFVQAPNAQQAGGDYFFFRPGLFADDTLKRIVDLVPHGKLAQEALADYRKVAGGASIDITGASVRCQSPTETDRVTPACSWWRLVKVVGEDIEATTTIFLAADTLRDDYSPDEVDALVRLGRYLVLLDWPRLDRCLEAIGRDTSDKLKVCSM